MFTCLGTVLCYKYTIWTMCIWRNINTEGAFCSVFCTLLFHLYQASWILSPTIFLYNHFFSVFWKKLRKSPVAFIVFHPPCETTGFLWTDSRENWYCLLLYEKLWAGSVIGSKIGQNLCHFTRRPTQICDSFGYRGFRITSLLWLTGTRQNGFTPKLCVYFSVCHACYMSPPLSSCLTLLL